MAASASRTTVRLTSDVWWHNNHNSTTGGTQNTLQLLPSAAFRILDHQLHASGILPNNLNHPSNNNNNNNSNNNNNNNKTVLYNHAWFCASQSVTCVPLPATLHTQQCLLSNKGLVKAHIWVTKIGTSSLQLANILTVDDNDNDANNNNNNNNQTVLATAQRVFVRSAPFSEPEKQSIWQRGGAPSSSSSSSTKKNNKDDSLLLDYYYGKGSETSSDTPAPSHGSPSPIPLPLLERFHRTFPFALSSSLSPILTVHIGPHHVNLGNHVDSAALLETAVHAMWLHGNQTATTRMINNPIPTVVNSVAINYLQEAKLGQVLDCWVHEAHTYMTTRPSSSSPPPRNNKGNIDESSYSEEPQLVVIAKAI
jgi:hypothetical protein